MLKSLSKRQIETSNNKLFGSFVSQLVEDTGLPIEDAIIRILETQTYQIIMDLEAPWYYLPPEEQYLSIKQELG
jgi:hypothetical protein